MEVTMVHPNNKDQKVVVTNERQYAAHKKMGFEDVPEKKEEKLEAAQTPALKSHPLADASKDQPEGEKSVEHTQTQGVNTTTSDKTNSKNASRKESK